MLRKLGSFTLAATLVSSLAVPAVAAAAPEQTPRTLATTFEAPSVPADQMPLGEGTAPREYFVRVAGTPAALHTEGEPGRPATSRVTSEGTLDYRSGSTAAATYEAELQAEQAEVAGDVAIDTVGRELEVLASYTVANHGFATTMTPAEARALAEHPDVTWVQEFPEYFPTTDRGPAFVNARGGVMEDRPGVWTRPDEGPATGITGDGIVVGVIDTGINPSSPSFQETTADGYTHTNPRDKFYGSCDPDFVGGSNGPIFGPLGDAVPYDEDLAELCNGKLIGMYGYTSITGSPIDYDGHGSHTAGTAAGGFADDVAANVGEVDVPGNSFDVSGVAPHASIISYGACCTGIALVSAIDQMIVDDVDVLNFSIGSSSPTTDLLQDPLTFGFLVARYFGIHVANSAGNAGPNNATISSPSDAPWLTTVASSTHDRLALNAVTGLPTDVFTDGRIDGKGVSGPLPTETPIVYAGDLDGAEDNPLCLADVWDDDDLEGLIVVCDRGQTGRVEKSEVSAAAGAVGYVLANDPANAGSVQASLNGDSFAIPGVHVTYEDGVDLKAWIAAAESPTATIAGTSFDVDERWGDTVSIFSSRGPNRYDANLLAPQVTAPGTDILAPYGSDDSDEYQFISGTSMSSPHVAGVLALLIDGFDGALTPAEAQSALQLTARRDVRKTDGTNPADPYDVGSGHVDVVAALATGLVMDADTLDVWDTFEYGWDTSELNLPALGQGQCVTTCSWTRTLTGAPGVEDATYTVSADAQGFDLDVAIDGADGDTFTVSDGEEVTITATADVGVAEFGEDLFGSIELVSSDDGVSDAHLPVVVRPSPFAGPDRVEIESDGYVDETTLTYTAADATGLQVDLAGLAPGRVDDLEVEQDPSNSDPFADFDDDAVLWLQAPEDVSRIVARIGQTTSPDIDLFVGLDVNEDGVPQGAETVCVSASSGSDESCDVLDPEPGDYWVLIQNWEASAAGVDPVEVITAIVAGDEDNLDVDAPASVGPGESFDIDLAWQLTAPTKHWFGLMELGSSEETRGEYPVPIDVTVVPEAPVADAGGPYRVNLGQQLTLDGSASSHPEGVAIDEWSWDVAALGIASPQPGETLTVQPSVAGDHQVTLTVTADGVTSTDTAVVTVAPADVDPDPSDNPACDQVTPVTFRDVGGPPHGDNVRCVAGYGIALGRADGNYVPLGDVRRDQMASFLTRTLRVAGATLPAAPSSTFSDVSGGEHALAIRQLADVGITLGRGGGRYAPADTVSRQEMATFLVRTLEYLLDEDLTPTGPGPFTDIGGTHAANIRVARELDIAQGVNATTFAPLRNVRRDQMGSFIARTLRVLDAEGIELTPLG